jgi:predicted TIM-barrel fold metal-dependent hydrolase
MAKHPPNPMNTSPMTRRSFVVGAVSAGTLLAARSMSAKAPQPTTDISFTPPPGSCDCHVHVFGDPAKYPMFPGRTYTPETATTAELQAMHRRLMLERVVIVTPSVYGTDNTATRDGVKEYGPGARGVAVINEQTSERELDELAGAGFRGIRLNLSTGGTNDPKVARGRFESAMARMAKRGWHIQTFTTLAMIAALKDLLATSPVPIVIDHFGSARGELGVGQPGFADLVALVKSGRAYVKISGAYQSSNAGPDYVDMAPLARALIAANSDRILWGSNWPHPGGVGGRSIMEITPYRSVDDSRMLNLLPQWAPDAALRKKILVENPARLYGF